MTKKSLIFPVFALCLLAVAPVFGEAYLIAVPPRPNGDRPIRVRLMGGVPFGGRPLELAPGPRSGLQRLWNSGRSNLGPAPVPPPSTAEFESKSPGVQLIAYTPPAGGQLEAGLAFAKALVVSGAAAEGETIWRSELGHRLELLPRTDPVRLARGGGPFEFQVLWEREPLDGATVRAVREGAPEAERLRRTTDPAGRATFDLSRSGWWVLHLVHESDEGVVASASLALFAGGAAP